MPGHRRDPRRDLAARLSAVHAAHEGHAGDHRHVGLRTDVKAFLEAEGRCPSNGEGNIGTPERYASTYVTRATVGEFDDGTCGFELEFGNTGNAEIDGRKLWWDLGSDNSEWHCSSEIDDKWLPPDCRG